MNRPAPQRRLLKRGEPEQCPRCKVLFDRPCAWVFNKGEKGFWRYPDIEPFDVDKKGKVETWICIECGCRILPDGRNAYPGGME